MEILNFYEKIIVRTCLKKYCDELDYSNPYKLELFFIIRKIEEDLKRKEEKENEV